MTKTRIFCKFRALITVSGLLLALDTSLANAQEPTADDGVTFVEIAGGDPENPAIFDKTGRFTARLEREAARASPVTMGGVSWKSVWPKIVHYPNIDVCEDVYAEIHPWQGGSLITRRFEFYRGHTDTGGKLCSDNDKRMSAPNAQRYVIGLWAIRALKGPVVRAAGSADDPLCIPGSMVDCPAEKDRAARFDAIRFHSVRSCGAATPDCVILGGILLREIAEGVNGAEDIDFRVEYSHDGKPRKARLDRYSFSRSFPVPPPLPGPPRLSPDLSAQK